MGIIRAGIFGDCVFELQPRQGRMLAEYQLFERRWAGLGVIAEESVPMVDEGNIDVSPIGLNGRLFKIG